MDYRVELTMEQRDQIMTALLVQKNRIEEIDMSLLDRDAIKYVMKELEKTNDAIEAIKGAKLL